MMNTKDTHLGELIFPHGGGLSDQAWLKIVSSAKVVSLLVLFGSDALEAVKAGLRDSIGSLFQVSLIDVLIKGWKKYNEVAKALEESRKKPADTILKVLVTHTVKSVHHPYVELFKDDTLVGKIQFDLTASIKVEGLTLKIQNGEVTAILAGTCQGDIQLAYDGEVLIDTPTERIDLPGALPIKSDTDQTIVSKHGSGSI
jgi:hypothetical protein